MSTPVKKKLGNIFEIGHQVDLPLGRIGDIAWRNMKHRFGRSLVTTSGVILATAFLMAMLIKNSVVGSMLQATRSLKAVVTDVPLTATQAANIITVLNHQKPGFDSSLKDSTDVLAENRKNLTTAEAALVTAQADLKKLENPDGTPLAHQEREHREAADAVNLQQREVNNALDIVKASETKYAFDKGQVERIETLLKTTQPGLVLSTKTGDGAAREEAVEQSAFLQRMGKQLENELQAHAIQDAAVAPATPAGLHGPAMAGAPVDVAAPPPPPPAPGASEGSVSAANPRDLWLTGLALVVAGVGITNAMLMSVTERFREIGTMKCLGALDTFIMKLFLIESTVQGGMGTLAGLVIGALMMVLYLLVNFGWGLMAAYWPWHDVGMDLLTAFGAGVLISLIGAAFPSLYASRMDPIAAMRQEI